MKIGVFGGTFDPPHLGHLALAEAALEALELDEVLWIPANRNPDKKYKRQASPADRLEMVRRLTEGKDRMSVSDVEISRGGSSYAVDTLSELQFAKPAEYWFLLGADAVKGIDTWKQPQRLLKLCRLGVALRPPETWENLLTQIKAEYWDKMDPVPMAPVDASSTEIRDRLFQKGSTVGMLAPGVLQYIRENDLYQTA